jgi:hypothetical protein
LAVAVAVADMETEAVVAVVAVVEAPAGSNVTSPACAGAAFHDAGSL